ncbi:MAG: Hsp20/alpha crystallin family protein [Deltaproteobacteria bacterium]|nr:Hsp20/alpha crystallin family protein [Candidatus Zymogenaceae bacterium]
MKSKEMELKNKSESDIQSAAEITREGPVYTPRVDIWENEKELTLMADIPGVEPTGLEIDLRDNTLTIMGKVKPEEDHRYILKEFGVGNYYRQFTLSEVIDQEKIAANVKNGVLTLTLPKVERAKPRKIQIN